MTGFDRVLQWITEERVYQTCKFDYAVEFDRPVEDWIRQFDSYIQRLPVFGVDTPQGRQAALKLASAVVGLCEHMAESADLPAPGVPSGVLEPWDDTAVRPVWPARPEVGE